MPLVEPLGSDHDPEVAELARFFNETLGFPPNSVLTMQRRPAIAKAFIALNKAVMANEGRVTAEQKRLIGLLASTAAGCRYCQAHTALAAERYGASRARLDAIWDYQSSDLFTAAEKAAFDFAVSAASVPNAVDAAVAGRLREAGNTVVEQDKADCCYAVSDKAWTADPNGLAWETFHSTGELTRYGDDTIATAKLARMTDADETAANPDEASGCCRP